MATHRITPFTDHILVFDLDRAMTTIDGIELPENVRQQDMMYGRVIAAGPLCQAVHPDDTIAYGPYAGKLISLDGVALKIMREGQAEARIDENVKTDAQ